MLYYVVSCRITSVEGVPAFYSQDDKAFSYPSYFVWEKSKQISKPDQIIHTENNYRYRHQNSFQNEVRTNNE